MRLNPMIAALCCLGIAIGSVSWLVLATRADTILPEQNPSRAAASVPSAREKLASESSFSAITERPLFQPSRRPAPAPIAAQQALPPVLTQPVPTGILLGVLISPDRHTAILRLADSRSVVVAEGSTVVDGWILQHVNPDRVVLAAGNQSIEWFFPKHVTSGSPAATTVMARPSIKRRN